MATEALKSDVITDNVASTQTNIDPQKKGHLSRQRAIATVSNGTIGSTYRMMSIPSNAVIKDVKVAYDDLLTGTVAGGFDVGIAFPLFDIQVGAVIDADLFANSLDCTSAQTPTSILLQSGVVGYDDLNKSVWDLGGSTLDQSTYVDIIATVVDTALDTTGKLVIDCEYVTGS